MPLNLGGGNGSVTYDPATGSLKYGDNTISTQLPIYTYGEQPNPWDVPRFTKIGYDPACLTGSGATTLAIEMQSDLVNWRFSGAGQVLYSKWGTIASPLVSGVAGGASTSTEVNLWGSLTPIMIPQFMMYKGFRGRFRAILQKSGTTATWDCMIRMGRQLPAGSITYNDQLHYNNGTLTNANGRQYLIDTEFIVTAQGRSVTGAATGETTAAFLTSIALTPNGNATNLVLDKSGYFSTRSDCYFNINVKGSSSDTFSLIGYSLQALPL